MFGSVDVIIKVAVKQNKNTKYLLKKWAFRKIAFKKMVIAKQALIVKW